MTLMCYSPVHAAFVPVALVFLYDTAVLSAVGHGALAVALVVLPLALVLQGEANAVDRLNYLGLVLQGDSTLV